MVSFLELKETMNAVIHYIVCFTCQKVIETSILGHEEYDPSNEIRTRICLNHWRISADFFHGKTKSFLQCGRESHAVQVRHFTIMFSFPIMLL